MRTAAVRARIGLALNQHSAGRDPAPVRVDLHPRPHPSRFV
jgi:hypothetical protein